MRRQKGNSLEAKQSHVIYQRALYRKESPWQNVHPMNVSNKRVTIWMGLVGVVGVWCVWQFFQGPPNNTGVGFVSQNSEVELLRRQGAEKDREILQLKEMLLAASETRTPKMEGGTVDPIIPRRPESVSEKGQLMQVGKFQIEQLGGRALVKDEEGRPLFVFDSEHRSVVAPNGMYIPNEGRLVMADAPPAGMKSENAEKPVKLGFKNDSSTRLDLAWVNYDGKLSFYKTLQPGQSYEQNTFETHPWVAVNPAGKILDLIKPTKEDEGTQFIFAPAAPLKAGVPAN